MTIRAGATTAGVADGAGKRLAHHAPAGGHDHEEERAQQLGEQTSSLLAWVVEIADAFDDVLLVAGDRAERVRHRWRLPRGHSPFSLR